MLAAPAKPTVLTFGYSPDADDVAMWWPIVGDDVNVKAIDTSPFEFHAVTEDIESLNRRSILGELDITAMSCAQYAYVADTYAITSCGCSMGDGFGPKLVAKPGVTIESLQRKGGAVVAVPGERTTAFAALSVLLGPDSFAYVVVPFDEILSTVAAGDATAGLLIHETQLTFDALGLVSIADVAQQWAARFGLPLPLGINAIRKDLEESVGTGALAQVTNLLHASIAHSMKHRATSHAIAQRASGGLLSDEALTKYLALYVNAWTLNLGAVGRLAVERLLDEIARIGLAPKPASVEFVVAEPHN